MYGQRRSIVILMGLLLVATVARSESAPSQGKVIDDALKADLAAAIEEFNRNFLASMRCPIRTASLPTCPSR